MSVLFAIYAATLSGFSAFNIFTHVDRSWQQEGAWQSHIALGLDYAFFPVSTESEGFGGSVSFGRVFVEQTLYFPVLGRKVMLGPSMNVNWFQVLNVPLRQEFMGGAVRVGIKSNADDGTFFYGKLGAFQDSFSVSGSLGGTTVSASTTSPPGFGGEIGVGIARKMGEYSSGEVYLGLQGRKFLSFSLLSVYLGAGVLF